DRRRGRGHQDPLGLPAGPALRVTRRLAACLLAAAALGAAGCRDTTNSTSTGGDTVTIYSVLPLEGPSAAAARDVADGEKRARRAGLARAATVPRGACAVLAASQAGPAARAAGVLPAARAVLAPSALAGPAFARALGSGGPAVTVLVADPQAPPAVAAAYARTFGRRAA